MGWIEAVHRAAQHPQGVAAPFQRAFVRGGIYAQGQPRDNAHPGLGQLTGHLVRPGGGPGAGLAGAHDADVAFVGRQFPFQVQHRWGALELPQHWGIIGIPHANQPQAQPGCFFALFFGQALLERSGIGRGNFAAQQIGNGGYTQVGGEGLLQTPGANLGGECKGQGVGHSSHQDSR